MTHHQIFQMAMADRITVIVLIGCLLHCEPASSITPRVGEPASSISPTVGEDHTPDAPPVSCHPCKCSRIHGNRIFADCDGKNLHDVPRTLPDEIFSLSMRSNKMRTVNRTMFRRFHSLSSLNIAYNRVFSIEEKSFEKQIKLRELDMQGNCLLLNGSTYKPLVFYGLHNLLSLKLNNNSDTMRDRWQFPSEAFADLTSLESLTIDGLSNMTFGQEFSGLKRLVNLSISGTHGYCDTKWLFNYTFTYLGSVKILELSHCRLITIEPGAFEPLRNLRILDLSENHYLGFDNFGRGTYSLQGSPIEILKINFITRRFGTCQTIRKSHLQFLSNTTLKELDIDGNGVVMFEEGALEYAPASLTTVSAQYNKFTFGPYFKDLIYLKNLKSVNIGDKGMNYKLPLTLGEKDTEMVGYPLNLGDLHFVDLSEKRVSEMLSSLVYQTNELDNTLAENDARNKGKSTHFKVSTNQKPPHHLVRYPLPPNISRIQMKWLKLFYHLDEFGITENKLTHLDLSYNIFSMWFGPIHGVETVQTLDLSSNFAHYINVSFFENFRSLKTLDISNNFWSRMLSDATIGEVFSHLPTLEVLNISNCRLSAISENMMEGLKALQEFICRNNRLQADYLKLNLSYARNLTLVDFSNCTLDTVPKNLRNQLDYLAEERNVSIDISFNPLLCVCWNLEFFKWLSTTRVHLRRWDHWYCIRSDGNYYKIGNATQEVKHLERLCQDPRIATLVAVSSASILVFSLFIMGCIVFRFRWKLYYLYYVARNQSAAVEAEGEEEAHFLYDAFVVLDMEDRHFVHDQLRLKLEEEQGLRLCLPYRDLTPGRFELQGTVEAIHNSRRTVCLLTANFLDSNECRFMFEMARMESLHENRDVVLFVLKDHVISRSLPRDILYYIKTESYVEYPRDERCVHYFWDNLIKALKSPEERNSIQPQNNYV